MGPGLSHVMPFFHFHALLWTQKRKRKVWNKAKTMHIALATGLVSLGSYTLESWSESLSVHDPLYLRWLSSTTHNFCVIHRSSTLSLNDLWIDKHVEDPCKQRAEFFHCSIIIVHTQCGQWQASLTQEKLAALTEVSDLQTPRTLVKPSLQKQCASHSQEPENDSEVKNEKLLYMLQFQLSSPLVSFTLTL